MNQSGGGPADAAVSGPDTPGGPVNASRNATLVRTLQDGGVPAVPIMRWFVPAVEFSAGCALIIGMLSALAAFGLFVITSTAIALDGIKRIPAWQPINRADWLADLLYLPESLYCIGLAIVVSGPAIAVYNQRLLEHKQLAAD